MKFDDSLNEQLRQLVDSDSAPSAHEVQQLRRRFGSDWTAILVESAALQRKACIKFGEGFWWATARALQQSTAWQVARLKSTWFGDGPVADLCCGIGGDSAWLAKRGTIVGVDSDPTMIALAEANQRQTHHLTNTAAFVCDDSIHYGATWEHAIHIDPDRRMGDRRTSTPDYYTPSWSDVLRIVERAPAAVVKLAPAAEIESTIVNRATHHAWISLRGSVREQSLLVGDAVARAEVPINSRSAIAIRSDGTSQRFVATETGERATIVTQPLNWIVDPDAAIRAGGLTDAFAVANDLHVIGAPSGFLTAADDASELSMSIVGRLEWFGSSDERKLKKEMRLRGVFPAVVKVRGVDRDPVKVMRSLKNCGQRPVTLWFGCVGKKVYAAWSA